MTSSEEKNNKNFLEIDPTGGSKLSENLKIVKDSSLVNDAESPPRICRLEESSVLGRVKNFLPLISKANLDLKSELSKGNGEKFDIENIEESEKIIEMDLSLVPNGCDGSRLPSAIQDLLDPSVESDSDSSEPESVDEVQKGKDLIEEV